MAVEKLSLPSANGCQFCQSAVGALMSVVTMAFWKLFREDEAILDDDPCGFSKKYAWNPLSYE
jgi:hypothetical protein